jgi:hypothetical protein
MSNNETNPSAGSVMPPAKKARPGFLTVLCILTYIGSGLTCVKYLADYMLHDNGIARIQGTPQVPVAAIGLGVVSSVLKIWGASSMMSLKRKGFFLYLGGEVALLAGMCIGSFSLPTDNSTIPFLGATAFFSVLFVILYALNLKHLK